MNAREQLEQLDKLRAEGTPGPWEAELCEGELTVSAETALTAWTEHDGFRMGAPASSYRSTDRIYEHELETWDADSPDDERRVADADLIVAAVNALPQHTAALRAVLDLAEELERDANAAVTASDVHRGSVATELRAAITEALDQP